MQSLNHYETDGKQETIDNEIWQPNEINMNSYQIVSMFRKNGLLTYQVKNLNTGKLTEHSNAEIQLYFYSEYLEYMNELVKKKKS